MASLAILALGEDGSGSGDLPETTEAPEATEAPLVQMSSTTFAAETTTTEATIDTVSRRRPICSAEVIFLLLISFNFLLILIEFRYVFQNLFYF